MIAVMLLIMTAGFAVGYLEVLPIVDVHAPDLIMICIYLMMFVAGIDMGKQGVIDDIKNARGPIIAYALATIAGTFASVGLFAPLLALSIKDAFVVASGMGWYSLSVGLILEYSPALSMAAFVYCMARELFALFLMPLLWRRFGIPELVSIAGSATINPSIAATAATGDQAFMFYGMLSGSIVSLFVPLLVSCSIAL